ncbi:PQQ-binding-like beta-propeller repeat protein, partial [bacterium]|nr:PQQ-binding-like beta-propeller repeat protein [bacterium]
DQPHMVCFSRGGVAAQGYLAVTKDHVLVATGRSVPAVFDRKTGAFIHFNLSRYGGKTPWGTGGGDVTATDDVFFNAGMAFDMATGLRYHPVGRREWWKPFQRDGRKLHGEFLLGPRQVICVTSDGFVRSEGPAIFGSTLARRTYKAQREADTARATPRLTDVGPAKGAKGKHHLERIDNAPLLKDEWNTQVSVQPEALIVAGHRIAWGGDGRIGILDARTKMPLWSAKVDGVVHALAAAKGRLYASTDKGAILCFGTGTPTTPAAQDRKVPPYAYSNTAPAVLGKTGITKGFALLPDCDDGSLAYALVTHSHLHVLALAPDAATASVVRQKLDAAGVYGVRVSVLVAGPKDLPDHFANLIVGSRTVDGLARLQRPYGGALCIGDAPPRVRGDLAGAGHWTHNFADAGNTMDSGDTLVRGPLGMLWYQDETQVTIDRHGKNPAPLATRGVLLREGVHSLRATDAFNGTLLWEASLPGVLAAYQEGTQVGAAQIGSTYCVGGDVVYVRQKDTCLRLDLQTGKRLAPFTAPALPSGKKGRWAYVAVRDGVLYGTLMNESYVIKAQHGDGGERMQKPMDDHLTESSLLFALDARTGKTKWTYAPKHSIRNNTLAIGKGLAYLIDRKPAEMDTILRSAVTQQKRRGEAVPEHPLGTLLALDTKTGKVAWKDDKEIFGTVLAVSVKHDALLMSYGKVGFARPSEAGKGMRAYRASTGERLWEANQSGTRPTMVGRTIYSFPSAWDLLTGKPRLLAEPRPDQPKGAPWKIAGKGQGCGLVAGCENMLLIRSGAIGYYDLDYDCGWLENYGGIRSGCFLNYLPVGGIVLVPDDTRACRCSYQNQASSALAQHGVRPPDIDPQPGQSNFHFGRHAKEPIFTGSLAVVLTHERDDVEIRYTLDDTYPTADSPLYTKPLTITKTTPIRATAFLAGRKAAVRDVVVFTKVEKLGAQAKVRRGK